MLLSNTVFAKGLNRLIFILKSIQNGDATSHDASGERERAYRQPDHPRGQEYHLQAQCYAAT